MDQRKKVGELISMNADRPGVIHVFEEDKITIGRDEDNTNPIYDNRIAYFHCSIFFQDGQVVLKNLAAQGTFINKEKIGVDMEVNLEHGDRIHLLCQKGKKVTEKHVIAYMFFKYENKKQSTRKSSKCRQAFLELINDDLICIICSEMYYEGGTVSPCGHVFCGHCLEVWEEKNNTCPICRLKMRNITKAFQINKIISTFLEVNPDFEMNPKPKNRYFLQAAENDEQNQSESDISESEYSDSDDENDIIRRLQGDQNLRRQLNNINIDDLLALNNQLPLRQNNQQGFENRQPPQPHVAQIQLPQPLPVNQRIDQPQNNQQNAQAQQNQQQNAQQGGQQNVQAQNAVVQNAQNAQQNGLVQNRQAQNAVVQNGQAQNVQAQNLQAINAQAFNQLAINIQAINGQAAQNAQAQNRQAQNGQVNQQRVNNQLRPNNNPPPRRPAVQANQQRVQQPPPNQQNAQINQRRPNVPPVVQANQPRANPQPPLNQGAQQNQPRVNLPPPNVVAQQNVQIIPIPPNPHQNQAPQQPPQQVAQMPLRQNQVEQNNRLGAEVNFQVQIRQPVQPQNQQPQIIQPQIILPQQPQQLNVNQPQQAIINKECRSCNVEYKGFKCQPYTGHRRCFCLTRMPPRELNTHQNANLKLFCQVCKSYFCKFYYEQICEDGDLFDINELTDYREEFNFQHSYFNQIERTRISRHLAGQPSTTIFDFVIQQYISKEQFYFQQNKALQENVQIELNELLLPNSPICTRCMRDVQNQIVFRYVQTFKYEEVQFMMPDCWYGINCKIQHNNVQHAIRFNHICEQTKFD